jgi:hypothetical protein
MSTGLGSRTSVEGAGVLRDEAVGIGVFRNGVDNPVDLCPGISGTGVFGRGLASFAVGVCAPVVSLLSGVVGSGVLSLTTDGEGVLRTTVGVPCSETVAECRSCCISMSCSLSSTVRDCIPSWRLLVGDIGGDT